MRTEALAQRRQDAEVDEAIRLRPALEAFLNQGRDEVASIDESFAALEGALR